MKQETRDRIAIAGVVLGTIAIILELLRRSEPVRNALKSLADGSAFQLPQLMVPQLSSGDIVFNIPDYAGNPFSGTSVGQAPESCGCSPYQCPTKRVEFVQLPATLVTPTIAIAPPVFNYQPAALSKTCAWNAAGYLSANPTMEDEWIKFSSGKDAAWNRARKKWQKRGLQVDTRDQFLYAHWVTWGQQEGWKYDCP